MTEAAQEELSNCCVFRGDGVQVNPQFVEVDATTTVFFYPLSDGFSVKFLDLDLRLGCDAVRFMGERYPLRLDCDAVMRLIVLKLAQNWEVLVQIKIQEGWVCAFETGMLGMDAASLYLELHGRACVFFGEEPSFLLCYPHTNEILGVERFHGVSAQAAVFLLELCCTPYLPARALLRMPLAQLSSIVEAAVASLQKALNVTTAALILSEIDQIPSSVQLKPGFSAVLEEAFLRSSFVQKMNAKAQETTRRRLETFRKTHRHPGQSFARFREDVVYLVLHPVPELSIENLHSFDFLEHSLELLSHPDLKAFCTLECTRKGVSPWALSLLKRAFTYDRTLAEQHLKLLLHFNPRPFLALLRGEFQDRQVDMAFLVRNFSEFPAQFQTRIVSLAYRHREDIIFELHPAFLEAHPTFKYIQGQLERRYTYASLIHPTIVFQAMRTPGRDFLKENEFIDRSEALRELGLEEVQELKAQSDEEIDPEVECCPVCLGVPKDFIHFGCSHTVCGPCFKQGHWEQCPTCREQIKQISFQQDTIDVI